MAAFSPRDFHCTQQALVIRNRNLTLSFFGFFFLQDNYGKKDSASSEKVCSSPSNFINLHIM